VKKARVQKLIADAAAKARASGHSEGYRQASAEAHKVIMPQPDEVVFGSPPEGEFITVAFMPADPRSPSFDYTRPMRRDVAVEHRFRAVPMLWRCPDTGRLVRWWTWEHVGARPIPLWMGRGGW